MAEYLTIYDRSSLHSVPWSKIRDGIKLEKFLIPLMEKGPDKLFDNVVASVMLLQVDDTVMPLTLNNCTGTGSYVNSPYTHFVRYGLHELESLKHQWAVAPLKLLLKGLGQLFQWGQIDKLLFVNNWLVPTNLYPFLSEKQVADITKFLLERYPDYTIAFRSINQVHPQGLYSHLAKAGYDFVPSRAIYYTPENSTEHLQSRMYKSDLKVLNSSAYIFQTLLSATDEELQRMCALYRQLNTEKYSDLNPQFNPEFIKLALESGWFTFKVLRKDDKIDAVLGYYQTRDAMTSPCFGYDTSLPKEAGLYRSIATRLLLDAQEKKLFLHQSAGAGHFKMLRRAKQTMEYTAVYHKHLSSRRRFPWKLIQWLMNAFGKYFMDR